MRLGVGAPDQVAAELLGPLRPDRGVLPGPEPAGLDQLAGHQVRRVLAAQGTPREDRELRSPGAEVLARTAWAAAIAGRAGRDPLPLLERADVGEQAAQEGLVDAV